MALTHSEIELIEQSLGRELPELYRRLLAEMGLCEWDECQIYHPLAVRELYEPFFDDPGQLFNPYFPFGCNNVTQELWIIDASTQKAASIWHETVPDDWPSETWLSYEDWMQQYLDPVRRTES